MPVQKSARNHLQAFHLAFTEQKNSQCVVEKPVKHEALRPERGTVRPHGERFVACHVVLAPRSVIRPPLRAPEYLESRRTPDCVIHNAVAHHRDAISVPPEP
jgi:hypothetical protein